MSKRGNNEGSVYRRKDGRWTGAFTRADGSRGYVYAKTRAEAARKLRDAQTAATRGMPIADLRTSLAKFLEQWLADVKPNVRPNTWIGYEGQVRLHLVPALGRLPIGKLAPDHLTPFYRSQLAAGLSPRSVQFSHAVLRMALEQGVRRGVLPRNVAKLVDAPRVPRKNVRSLDIEQARDLRAVTANDRLSALYTLVLCTGLRRGEVLGLGWDELDLDAGLLSIRYTLSKTAGGWERTEPKTQSSRRVVRLPEVAVDELRQHRTKQRLERLQAGPSWIESGLVFTSSVGTPIDGSNLLRAFKAQLKAAGLPDLRFHDLRHSAATFMLVLGVQPKVVSEMLGHSRVGVTLDTYSHVLPHLQEEAAAKMNRLLGGVAVAP